MQAFFYMG